MITTSCGYARVYAEVPHCATPTMQQRATDISLRGALADERVGSTVNHYVMEYINRPFADVAWFSPTVYIREPNIVPFIFNP